MDDQQSLDASTDLHAGAERIEAGNREGWDGARVSGRGEVSTHTPGPWVTDRKAALRVVAVDDITVCSTGCADSERDRWQANARLIAAAPELLESCETLLFELVAGPACRDEAIAAARAAIAKATGAPA